MSIDLEAAIAFVAGHARILDRRRLDLMLGGDAAAVLPAVDAYRNADAGFGWGIEPDLRAPGSQPVGAMHALEVLAEVAAAGHDTGERGATLCDWLAEHSSPEGALPFTLPIRDPAGCAAIWLTGDHTDNSLRMTAQIAANAHRLAAADAAVAAHPWLAAATRWTCAAIARLDAPHAYELMFAVRFLDAVADHDADAATLLDDVRRLLPPDGVVPVEGGTPEETLRPLDFAPRAGGAARRLFGADVIAADLERLARRQQPDGGWTVDFASASPAAALEWRGYATVAAVAILHPSAAAPSA
jgi:hypothetical protein